MHFSINYVLLPIFILFPQISIILIYFFYGKKNFELLKIINYIFNPQNITKNITKMSSSMDIIRKAEKAERELKKRKRPTPSILLTRTTEDPSC